MAREMTEREKQWAKLVEQYGSEEAVLAAYKKKKELAERDIEKKAEYQNQFFSPKSIGESMPGKPSTEAQRTALIKQAFPDALLGPVRPSIKDEMTTTGVPSREDRESEYKGFLDEAALSGQERARRGESPIVESTVGRREELLTEALPFHRAAEREKYGGVGREALEARHQREKGLMGGIGGMSPSQRARLESAEARGEGIAFDDPEIAGESKPFTEAMKEEIGGRSIPAQYRPDIIRDGRMSWRGKEKELGGERMAFDDPEIAGESIPFTQEMAERTGGKRLDLNDPENRELLSKIAPEKAATLDMGDIEQQVTAGQKQDEEERAVNEEFMMNASSEEQEEVIAQVSEEMGPFHEATAASKEATGRYVRYDGATKKGITINKSYLEKLYDRKGKMALLQHIPQENRAALMFNWGLISGKDLSDTQQQSAKEVLELEKIGLQIAELKNKTGKMSDTEKAQVNAASNGLAQAVKDRRWDEAEGFQAQLNELMPDRKPLDFAKIQLSIDNKLKELPALDRAKSQMGTQVWDGYFEFKNKLVTKIDLLKRSTAGSGDLAKFLGAPITEGENAGKTWSDVLESQGYGSWTNIEKLGRNSVDGKRIALKLTNGKHDDITKITRSYYMGMILPQLKNRIMKNNYGKWYTMIEGGLKNAQKTETEKHQHKINNDPEPFETDPGRPKPEDEGLSESALEAAKEAALTAEEEAEFAQELSETEAFLRDNDYYGLYDGVQGNMRLKNKLVEMIKRKKERDKEGKGSIQITPRHGSRRRR